MEVTENGLHEEKAEGAQGEVVPPVKRGRGRPVGSQAIHKKIVEEILNSIGCCPVTVLANIAMGKPTDDGQIPDIQQRADAAKEIMKYIYTQRKAITVDSRHTEVREVTFSGDPVAAYLAASQGAKVIVN